MRSVVRWLPRAVSLYEAAVSGLPMPSARAPRRVVYDGMLPRTVHCTLASRILEASHADHLDSVVDTLAYHF
jgi:hypothetical protein